MSNKYAQNGLEGLFNFVHIYWQANTYELFWQYRPIQTAMKYILLGIFACQKKKI